MTGPISEKVNETLWKQTRLSRPRGFENYLGESNIYRELNITVLKQKQRKYNLPITINILYLTKSKIFPI